MVNILVTRQQGCSSGCMQRGFLMANAPRLNVLWLSVLWLCLHTLNKWLHCLWLWHSSNCPSLKVNTLSAHLHPCFVSILPKSFSFLLSFTGNMHLFKLIMYESCSLDLRCTYSCSFTLDSYKLYWTISSVLFLCDILCLRRASCAFNKNSLTRSGVLSCQFQDTKWFLSLLK